MVIELERPRIGVQVVVGKPRIEAKGVDIFVREKPKSIPEALREILISRGLDDASGYAIGKAFGYRGNTPSNKWLSGKDIPSLKAIERIRVRLNLNPEELKKLNQARDIALKEKTERNRKGSPERSKQQAKPSTSPLGKWFESTASEKRITLKERFIELGLSASDVSHRGLLGLPSIMRVMNNIETLDELGCFLDVLIMEIEHRQQNGHRFQKESGATVKRAQLEAFAKLNGAQVARMLRVSRETISNIRKELELPVLLTYSDVALIARRLNGLAI